MFSLLLAYGEFRSATYASALGEVLRSAIPHMLAALAAFALSSALMEYLKPRSVGLAVFLGLLSLAIPSFAGGGLEGPARAAKEGAAWMWPLLLAVLLGKWVYMKFVSDPRQQRAVGQAKPVPKTEPAR